MQKQNKIDLIEYIKIQWTDIHHTRNQEWRVLIILVGIFYALLQVNLEHVWLHIGIVLTGLVACGMGMYMTLIHWMIFYNKMRVIAACEEESGIYANLFQPPLPVQGLILLIYFLIAAVLLGWLTWLLWGKILTSFLASGLCFLVGLFICVLTKQKIKKSIEKIPQVQFKNIGVKK